MCLTSLGRIRCLVGCSHVDWRWWSTDAEVRRPDVRTPRSLPTRSSSVSRASSTQTTARYSDFEVVLWYCQQYEINTWSWNHSWPPRRMLNEAFRGSAKTSSGFAAGSYWILLVHLWVQELQLRKWLLMMYEPGRVELWWVPFCRSWNFPLHRLICPEHKTLATEINRFNFMR